MRDDICPCFWAVRKLPIWGSRWDVHSAWPFTPAHNARKVPWLSDLLKQAPLQSQGSTPRPWCQPEETTPPSVPNWETLMTSLSPQFKKKKKDPRGFPSLACAAGGTTMSSTSLLLVTMEVETTKPQAAVKLNNSQGKDGRSITVRSNLLSLSCSRVYVEICGNLQGSQIEVSWCWVETNRARRCSAEKVHLSWTKPERVCENFREYSSEQRLEEQRLQQTLPYVSILTRYSPIGTLTPCNYH